MRYFIIAICLSSLSLLARATSLAIADLPVYPGAELVQEAAAPAPASHRIVLGALEKVNNELVPERAEIVRGVKTTATWYLPEARRTSEVGSFIEQQLTGAGPIIFQCEGRACGSSSFWANTVLQRAILYGPEQHQRYYLTRTTDPSGYLAAYVGQRATRKIYLHIEFVAVGEGGMEPLASVSKEPSAISSKEPSAGGGKEPSAISSKEPSAGVGKEPITSDAILVALETTGRYIFTPASDGTYPANLAQIVGTALSRYAAPVALVAHDRLREGESLNAAINRTQQEATTLAEAIQVATSKPLQLDARGVGPLAPSDTQSATRLELVVPGRQ